MAKPKILKKREEGEYFDYMDEVEDDLSFNSCMRELDNAISRQQQSTDLELENNEFLLQEIKEELKNESD